MGIFLCIAACIILLLIAFVPIHISLTKIFLFAFSIAGSAVLAAGSLIGFVCIACFFVSIATLLYLLYSSGLRVV